MGWRRAVPALPYPLPPQPDRDGLFEAARAAGRALDLPAGPRFVLDQLCAAFRGELVEDRLLVWPSNEFLVEKTGLAERTVRHCLRYLIDQGIIIAKDSPNGKRYAQRGSDGRIFCAYGFDLSPLLARQSEFRDRLIARAEEKRDRNRAFDEITIARRRAESALTALPESRRSRYSAQVAELTQRAPRRSGRASPYPVRDLWRKLLDEIEGEVRESGSGGNFCRHKDTNTKAPESPCDNGNDAGEVTVSEALNALPDAVALMGMVRSERDLVEVSERMRGYLGVSRSAWTEAVENLGPLLASLILAYCIQVQAKPAPGARQIENIGGYYRSICRLVSAGKLDFGSEVRRLRARLT